MQGIHHLKLFGEPRLLDPSGHLVGLRTRKHVGLLVYLALEGRDHPVHRDTLMGLFWRDVPEARANHSLSQALTAIRDRLGRAALPRSTGGVRLCGGLTTDLDSPSTRDIDPKDFARPLDGLEGFGGTAFAHWVDRTRETCRRQLHTQLMADLTAARTVGQLSAVNRAAVLLYAIDPHSDTAALALAEQYLLEGDTTGAMRLLRDHNARSENELGRDPPRQITLLLQRLERGCLPRRVPAAESDAGGRPSLATAEVFVGREHELSRLEAAWTSACRGGLTKCLISGVDGIGKSALVRRFITSVASRAWPAYLIACQEIGQSIPFATVSDLVHQLMRDPALSGTDPRWLAEASRVTPGLRTMYTGIPEPTAIPAEAVRLRVAEALSHMLATVSDGGPLLLVLDHLQNIDPASRDVLHVLSLRLEQTPTLLLATMRSSETEFILSGPAAAGGVEWPTSIELEPLGAAQMRELIAHLEERTGDLQPAVSDRIVEFAQGNPYLTEMLLSDWRNKGPDSLVMREMGGSAGSLSWRPPPMMRSAFERQYHGISPDGQLLIHLLAVAGRCVPISELDALLGISASALDRAALELIDRAIVRTAGGVLGFKSELHRAFIYWAMSGEARTYHHARLARSLTASAEQDDFQRALEASHHYLKAGMPEEAVEQVCMGAELAVLRGAPQEAERALKAVLTSLEATRPPSRTRLLLAMALGAEGKYTEALDELASWKPSRPSPLAQARAATLRAEALHRARLSDDATIMKEVNDAISLAEMAGDQFIFMQALQLKAEAASDTGSWQELDSVRDKATLIQRTSTEHDPKVLSCLTQGYCLLVAGDAERAHSQFETCIDALETRSLDIELRQALNGLGVAEYCLGAYEDAIRAFERAIAVANRIGNSVASATSWSNLGVIHEDLGHFDRAEDCYRRAIALEALSTNPRRSVEVHMNMAGLQLYAGDANYALHCLDVARRNALESRLWWLHADVLLTEADYHIVQNTPELAWPLVEEAQAAARGRVYLLSNRGRFERLRRHHLWISQGFEAVRQIEAVEDLHERCIQLSGRLEVRALVQWISNAEGSLELTDESVFDEITSKGLHGLKRRLDALRVSG